VYQVTGKVIVASVGMVKFAKPGAQKPYLAMAAKGIGRVVET
jgi:hypothetical protein